MDIKGDAMKCPVCAEDFKPKRADAKTCGKSSCQKKLQRESKKRLVVDDDEYGHILAEPPLPIVPSYETYSDWLLRRCKEENCPVVSINYGYPIRGKIKLPARWVLDDVDTALEYEGVPKPKNRSATFAN